MAFPVEDHSDDGTLVLAVQGGDAAAFDALFRRHYLAVRQACLRRLVDPVEADEVAQAAFVRAFERIDQCSGQRRFGPWVHVIARSICMDAFRARARVEPVEEPFAGSSAQQPNEPEESLLRGERAAHVHKALAALPERQRSAVIARDWEGLRPGEIADRLGVSIGAVDSLLLRARSRMARSYRRLAGEAGGGASTRTLRSAAAATVVALLAGPHAIVAASAAAADALHDTASRAAVGVVGAVVSVGLSLTGPAPVPAPGPPDPPPAVAIVVADRPPAAYNQPSPVGTVPSPSPPATFPSPPATPVPPVPPADTAPVTPPEVPEAPATTSTTSVPRARSIPTTTVAPTTAPATPAPAAGAPAATAPTADDAPADDAMDSPDPPDAAPAAPVTAAPGAGPPPVASLADAKPPDPPPSPAATTSTIPAVAGRP